MSYEQDLSADVSENGDLKVVSMRELRDGFEFKRLVQTSPPRSAVTLRVLD
jgi:hypothetical protein